MAIASKVLKTISENTAKYGGNVYGMWVIQYYDPEQNKSIAVKVVCGERKDKDDGSRWYVAKGMCVKDFEKLKPYYPEFKKLSDNPPAIVPMAAEGDNSQKLEDVPF